MPKPALACLALSLPLLAAAPAPPQRFTADFQQLPPGPLPEEGFLTLNGAFEVKAEGDNKLVEVPGEPIDGFGFLAGPDAATSISARARAAATGKRFPEFAVGLGGPAGHLLWAMPATGELRLVRNYEVLARAPLTWKSGTWTRLKLQLRPLAEGKHVVEGKAWPDGSPEPDAWQLRAEVTLEAPHRGRASAWASPYSSKPIAFDDLLIE